MKTKMKALTLVLCAVMLVATTVFATVAFLTSTTATVENTFTVGNVTITLDEAKVDEYGVADNSVARVTANTYKLIPGHSYTKDPIIHVGSTSEDCWLFVKLYNGLQPIIAATTIEEQMQAGGWSVIDATNNIWAYNTKVSANTNVEVFESFKIKETETNLSNYEGKTITVQAYAVQADGFGTAAAAWEAAPLNDWITTAGN